MSSSSFRTDYFSDDTQRFLAALSSSDFLGDFSSLQNSSVSHSLPQDIPAASLASFSPLDFANSLDVAPSPLSQAPDLSIVQPSQGLQSPPSSSAASTFQSDSPPSLNESSASSTRTSPQTFANDPSKVSAKPFGTNGAGFERDTSSLRDEHLESISSRDTSPVQQNSISRTAAASELEKRKILDDMSDDDLSETDSKRRDTADSEDSKKKPGRKLMTAEPSNKRKAQNRAAQRAFRERKEKHLRDLEARVAELENDAHSMTTENQFLKKQVDRLQSELKEYRKRQSVSSSIKSSPSSSHNYVTPFTFEFPLFGADSKLAKQAQQGQQKPGQAHPRSSAVSPMASVPFGKTIFSAYSPSNSMSYQLSPDSSSSSSSSPTLTASGPNTSVKPSPCAARGVNGVYDNDEDDFCAQLSMACGTRENPIPKAQANSVLSPPSFENDLFAEYREPIFNNGEEEFTLPELTPDDMFDNLADVNDSSAAGSIKEEEVVPADNKPLMGCNALWDRISMHPKFGDLDIDGLCSELRTKAKCSESGVVVTESDLNAVLKKIQYKKA